jgi:hypothetical protein
MDLPKIKPFKTISQIDIEDIVNVGDDLDYEFRRQAAFRAWISTVHAESKAKTRLNKAQLELIEATLTNKIRKNIKGLTVADVNARVISSTKYREKLAELHESQLYEDTLKGFVDALDSKKDMLVQLGANSRQEIDPELRLMAKKLQARHSQKLT